MERKTSKVKKLVSKAPPIRSIELSAQEPPKKKIKPQPEQEPAMELVDPVWLKAYGCYMAQSDKNILLHGGMLNDRHIDFAQKLLLNQFPGTPGLMSTLLQNKVPCSEENRARDTNCA